MLFPDSVRRGRYPLVALFIAAGEICFPGELCFAAVFDSHQELLSMPTDVFISYSTRDSETAQALCMALERAGLSCWIAPRNITPGQTWSEAIVDGINDCQVMVLLYTSASNASPHV